MNKELKAMFISWLQSKEEAFINKKSTQTLFTLFMMDILKNNFDEIADIIFEAEKEKEWQIKHNATF
jgi:hypothetical protein